MTNSTADIIKKSILSQGAGTIIFTRDYSGYGSPEAVKKAMLRLNNDGAIVRLAQGIYYTPKYDTETGLGLLKPTLNEIAQAIAKRDKARIVPTGDTALNVLGLSTQVPANIVYMTDGSPRRIAVGKGRGILFKHTSDLRSLCYSSEIMMLIVSAMRTIGQDNLTSEQLSILTTHLSNVSKEDFQTDIVLTPIWIRKILLTLWNSIN